MLQLSVTTRFTVLFQPHLVDRSLEHPWASPPIVRATSAEFARTGFASAWRPSGVAQCSAVGGRKGASGSPFSFHRSTQAPESQKFPRSHRLTTRAELQNVGQKGKRMRTEHLEVRALASPSSHPRVGIIVPRYRRSAVDRNRVKRRLREIVRRALLHRLPAVDVVIRARPGAYDASYEKLLSELSRLEQPLCRVVEPR